MRNRTRLFGLTLRLGLALAGLTLLLSPAGSVWGEQTVIYVDGGAHGRDDGSSWMDAYTHLQSALMASASGHEIWVAEGTYRPDEGVGQTRNDRISSFVLKSGVALYGGFSGIEGTRDQRDWFAHPTILSGEIGATGVITDNAYHVATSNNVTGTAVLDGFTITGGYADSGSPTDRDNSEGGGMRNSGGSPTLANLVFAGNTAFLTGSGMHNADSDPTLINVTFSGNTVHHGGGGGLYNSGSNPTLINVAFSGNRAPWGGGIYNVDSSPKLINVTLSGNSASAGCGGILNDRSNSTVINGILWGNTPNQMCAGADTIVRYSLVQDGCPGSATCRQLLDSDPQFADADGADDVLGTEDDDLRLRRTSPAIDAGNNDAVPADTNDLDGDGDTTEPTPFDLAGAIRFANIASADDSGRGSPPIVDMGAYETLEQVYLSLMLR